MSYAFISYSRGDRREVESLVHHLSVLGIDTWFDRHTKQVMLGKEIYTTQVDGTKVDARQKTGTKACARKIGRTGMSTTPTVPLVDSRREDRKMLFVCH